MLDHIKEHRQNLVKSLYSSYNSIEKGGEGSRGGKVIGHTKSGKAIYENSQHTSKDFTAEDHSDAMSAHMKAAKEHSDNEKHYTEASKKYEVGKKDFKGFDHNKRLSELSKEHSKKSQHHSSMAALHQTAMNQKLDKDSKK